MYSSSNKRGLIQFHIKRDTKLKGFHIQQARYMDIYFSIIFVFIVSYFNIDTEKNAQKYRSSSNCTVKLNQCKYVESLFLKKQYLITFSRCL